jgi:ABC-2 type transport system ATP-binding protein
MNVVRAEGLGKRYGDKWGLKDATFTLEEGSVSVFLGPNGAGKTTTIKILTTVLKPSKGYAWVLGYKVDVDYEEVRRNIAYLPQECSLDNNWTPYEAVKWYLVSRGMSMGDASRETRYWLEKMGLWEARNKVGWRLSGGMKRKVLVSMVLASNAELIFLDEPTTGLDVEARYEIWGVLRRIASEGASIIFTTHDMYEAEMIADKIVLLNEGTVVKAGETRRLLEKFPYKYKVIIEGGSSRIDSKFSISLGDKRIIYLNKMDEVGEILNNVRFTGSIKVEKTGIEDLYLSLIRGGEM